MNLKEMKERKAKLEAELRQYQGKVAELDADKRAAVNEAIEEYRGLCDDIAAEGVIDQLAHAPADKDFERAKKAYDLGKVVRHKILGAESRLDIGFEKEVSDELAMRSGVSAEGILIPINYRDNETTTTTAAGTVPQITGEYEGALYPATVFDKLGVRRLTGLNGSINFPINSTKLVGTAKGEVAAADVKVVNAPGVLCTPHRVPLVVKESKQLLLQTSGSIEAYIRAEMNEGMGSQLEYYAINGSGSGAEVLGLANRTGVNSITNTSGVFNHATVVTAKSKVYGFNTASNFGWIIDPQAYAKAAATPLESGQARYVYEDGFIGGDRAEICRNAGTGKFFFGDWSKFLMLFWGAMDLVVDPLTLADQSVVRLVLTSFFDVHCRRPELFCKNSVTIQ